MAVGVTEIDAGRSRLPASSLAKALAALGAPIAVLSLSGSPVNVLLLYSVIVVEGFALGYLALSRIDRGERVALMRNNDLGDDRGYGRYYRRPPGPGRVESLALDVKWASHPAHYFSGSSRRRIGRVVSQSLPPSYGSSPSRADGGAGNPERQVDEKGPLPPDLLAVLSYYETVPATGGGEGAGGAPAAGRPPKRARRLPETVPGGRAGLLVRRLDLDYLSSLERTLSSLEGSS